MPPGQQIRSLYAQTDRLSLASAHAHNARVAQSILILQLMVALALQSGACRNKSMNDNQHKSSSPAASSPTPSPETVDQRIAPGVWGGSNILLEVTEAGARVEFACAHGTLSKPLMLKDGRFDVEGTFVRERGGPVREGEGEKGITARYRGEVSGEEMTFVLSLTDDGSDAETFKLTKGAHPRLFKCK